MKIACCWMAGLEAEGSCRDSRERGVRKRKGASGIEEGFPENARRMS